MSKDDTVDGAVRGCRSFFRSLGQFLLWFLLISLAHDTDEAMSAPVRRDAVDGTESHSECAIVLRGHPLKIKVCERNGRIGFRERSSFPKSEASSSD